MKKFVIVSLFFCFTVLLVTAPVLAVKPSPDVATSSGKTTSQEVQQERQEQIRELRERVATKVAELKEKGKRAWYGEIKSISGTTIILTTKQGEKTILTDEDTIFLRIGAGGRKKITLANLVVGEQIVALGQVDTEKGEMTAKVIIGKILPININGKVTAVDVEGGTLTVATLHRGSFIVDVETTTKILAWEKGKGLTKSGLSKIKVGDRVHVNGFTTTKPKEGENRITGNRILVLPGRAVGITGEKPATPAASPKTSPTASPTASPEAE